MSDERGRQADPAWTSWGPYVSERAWGTVREDYSAAGDPWGYFPHEHARSRAFRWSEDGLAGFCDLRQTWCIGLALWNGRDPILKERAFGLAGPEGNHGEDAKDYWWYVDATPTHSWNRWRYHYPQGEFPYAELVNVNGSRGKDEPEYELVDTGAFADDRFWAVTVDYAKAAPHDLVIRITVENKGPEEAALHVLPHLWFRNTWSWHPGRTRPRITTDGAHLAAGTLRLTHDGSATPLFCENETNTRLLYDDPAGPAYAKDGIGDFVVSGAATVNPALEGSKAALHYMLTVPPGGRHEILLRLSDGEPTPATAADVLRDREREADDFYTGLLPAALSPDERLIARQAFAGMLWGKQFYRYDVERWLDGDPAQPPPPPERRTGRNAGWQHLNNADIISMPDKWEYPWYAAWDLAFHTVALAHVDAGFAKHQLILMLREWYMHPNGQLPAYEWNFSDVNPPVHAWAALQVFEIDGSRDQEFLERVFQKLLLNFTWWVNRKDAEGNNVFEGGFLGLDNIGPLDRSAALPFTGSLEQSDGTAWMAKFCLDMLEISLVLAEHDEAYQDMATKFFEHFALIASAAQALWDEQDGFFYDVLSLPDGRRIPLRVRSMVGLLPLTATTTLGAATLATLPDFAARTRWFLKHKPHYAAVVSATHDRGDGVGQLLSVVSPEQLRRILARMLDETEFLSDHGLRALSRAHRDTPFVLSVDGLAATVDYEPGESRSGLFGGNSNWRGPIWFPVNHLVIEAIRRFARFYGDDFTVVSARGERTLVQVADDLADRLISIFRAAWPDGRRPVFGDEPLFQHSPDWHDLLPFAEYFHGDTGKGLGASHQTGWTGLVADLLVRRHT